MKLKLSLAAMCVCGMLQAATLEEARGYYNAKAYEEAYQAFSALVTQTPSSPEYNFLLGRSALETKRYDEALAAFERVLMLDPAHVRTRLEIARTYFELGQLEMASVELDRVLAASLPGNIREVVIAFKARVEEAKSKHRISGTLIAGMGVDTNINNDIGKREFAIPGFNITDAQGGKEVEDTFLFGTAVLNHAYDIGVRGAWTLEQSGVFYTKLHNRTPDNNMALFALSSAPTYKAGQYKVAFPVGFDKVYIDGKGYMDALSLGATGTYTLNPTMQLEGKYNYRRSYYDQDKELDAKSHALDASLRKVLSPEDPWVVALRVGYTKDDEVKSARNDVDATKWRYGAEVSRTLSYGIQGTLSYLRTEVDYTDENPFFLSKRDDTRQELGVRLTYPMSRTLALGWQLSYVDNDSNQAPYDYDKVTTMATVMWGF